MHVARMLLVEQNIQTHQLANNNSDHLQVLVAANCAFPILSSNHFELLDMRIRHLHSPLQRQLRLVQLLYIGPHVAPRRTVNLRILTHITRIPKCSFSPTHSRENAMRHARNPQIGPTSGRNCDADGYRSALCRHWNLQLHSKHLLVRIPKVMSEAVKILVSHLGFVAMHCGRVENERTIICILGQRSVQLVSEVKRHLWWDTIVRRDFEPKTWRGEFRNTHQSVRKLQGKNEGKKKKGKKKEKKKCLTEALTATHLRQLRQKQFEETPSMVALVFR